MNSLNLKWLKSFALFDLPVNYNYLIGYFSKSHQIQLSLFPLWPAEATSQRIVSGYWANALKHYLSMLAASIFVTLPYQFNALSLSILVITGFLVYIPLYFMIYRPTFNREFMPCLIAVIAEYEGKERLHREKCKRAQMSNTSQSIVFYIFAKTGGVQLNRIDTRFGDLLMSLFGSNLDSLQKALKLITCKVTTLSAHKQTELEKSLEEARTFFTKLEFPQGLEIISHLERKFRRL